MRGSPAREPRHARLRLLRVERTRRSRLSRGRRAARPHARRERLHARLRRRRRGPDGYAGQRVARCRRRGRRHHPAFHDRGGMAASGRRQSGGGRGHARAQAPPADRLRRGRRAARRLRHAGGTVRGDDAQAPRAVREADRAARRRRFLRAARTLPRTDDPAALHEPAAPRAVDERARGRRRAADDPRDPGLGRQRATTPRCGEDRGPRTEDRGASRLPQSHLPTEVLSVAAAEAAMLPLAARGQWLAQKSAACARSPTRSG